MTQVPEGWAEARLADLIGADGLFVDGDWIETKDQDPAGDVRLIQLADIGEGYYKNRSSRFLTSATARRLECTFLHLGDILVARMPEPIGRACNFPGDVRQSVTAVDICIVRPGSNSVRADWLQYTINAPQFRAAIEGHVRGTTRKRISRSNLASILMPVPPLAEQRRIVEKVEAVLSVVAGAVARLHTVTALIRRVRRLVLDAAYDGSLTAAQVTTHISFGDVCADLRGGNSATSVRTRTSWPVLRSSAVRPFEIQFDDLNYLMSSDDRLPNAEVCEGDLLITRLSGSVDYVGNCAVVRNRPPGTLQIPDRIFRARLQPEFNERFVEIMFNAPAARKPLEEAAKSSAGHQRISLSDVRSVQIPWLSLKEQMKVVQRVDVLMNIASAIDRHVGTATQRAAELPQAVLAKAFAGELVPTEAELARTEGRSYEPASVLLERIRNRRPAAPSRRRRARG